MPQTSALISPGSSASNDNVGEPTSRGPRRQLAQAQKTLLKLPQNGNLFCLKQQYTYRLACLRAPARSAKDNMKDEKRYVNCHLTQRNLERGQSEGGAFVI